MSVVTDVVVLCPLQDTVTLMQLNEALLPLEVGTLKDVSTYAGGHKSFQATIWAGAFNYLPREKFIAILRAFPWSTTSIATPRLFMQEEAEWGFKEVSLTLGKE